jgi:hypothetical protein
MKLANEDKLRLARDEWEVVCKTCGNRWSGLRKRTDAFNTALEHEGWDGHKTVVRLTGVAL